jgi:8-amino-7-oxononanoate synthase
VSYHANLADLAAAARLRSRRNLVSPQGRAVSFAGREKPLLSFASNDYLGLANHPALRAAFVEGIERYGVGAGAAPLAGGHFESHAQFEADAARFVGAPRALLFESGYMANLAMLTALSQRGDVIFCDKLNHACLNDGAQLAHADWQRYHHADANHLESLLKANTERGARFIATDAVFSMDGDVAPLADLLALAERYDTWLLLDDAHGFGVLGRGGRGAAAWLGLASPRIVTMATLGKAAGVAGAFVAGDADAVEWIMQTARPYLFATAMPPAQAHALLTALQLVEAATAERARLGEHIRALTQLRAQLVGHVAPPSPTAIQPIILGDNARTMAASDALLAHGMWVPGIRPPTVPEGSARLRVSLSSSHTVDDITALGEALTEVLGSAPA